ncbi:MAG: sugar nucleotide-binding protein [Coprococcus sp.]
MRLLGSGLQGLQTAERVRRDKAGRRAGGQSETLEKYFIVRIAWVFGKNGKNFIKTMLNVGKTHDTLRVVNDQIGTPTYTYDLARLLGGHDWRQINTATIHADQRGRLHQLVRFYKEIFPSGGGDGTYRVQ